MYPQDILGIKTIITVSEIFKFEYLQKQLVERWGNEVVQTYIQHTSSLL